MSRLDDELADPVAYLHSLRFRKVANAYARVVTRAYDRDIAAAALATDEEVASTVAAWEVEQGIAPRDWQAIGAGERDPDFDDDEWSL